MIIENAVKRYGLIEKGDKILIGFSGGADSVCLLHCLWGARERYGIQIFAAHVNHGLRGETADRDERFCAGMCERLGVPLFVKRADVRRYAEEKGISEETAGREVRYAFFDEVCAKNGINKTATAHHKNDLAETVVMNFIRGAGINGLSGIPPVRANIIRPLIDSLRSEIEEYCKRNGLEFVTDETNFQNVYRRNKIRLDLIPYIQREFNAGFVNSVAENARSIAADSEFIEGVADGEFEKSVVKTENGFYIEKKPLAYAIRSRVFMRMAQLCGARDIAGVHIRAVDALWEGSQTGKSCNLPCGVRARMEYGRLYIEKAADDGDEFEYKIETGVRCEIPEAGIAVTVTEDENGSFAFDGELCVRSRRAGDIFYPSGMKGSKKVKDYYVNEKIPAGERARMPLLVCGGRIAWIIGRRRDRRFFGKGWSVKVEKLDYSK